MIRATLALVFALMTVQSTAIAQWRFPELIVTPSPDAPEGARLHPFQIDPSTPSLEALEVWHAGTWTWFTPIRFQSNTQCRDIPLLVMETVKQFTIRDVDADGRDDLTLYLSADNTTRVFFGSGWNACRLPGEP